MYAKTFFEQYDVDALTVAPYMGEDSVTPFLGYDGKWVILLALTSNKGSQDFQMEALHTPLVGRWGPGNFKGDRLYEKVLKTSKEWGNEDNMMYVVGATQGLLFERVRDIVPHHFLLVPGVGAQGGSLEEVCKYGMTEDCGLLVNSSRGIIYASNDDHYAEIAGNKARELQQQMAEELKKAGII
jgi:orotidine-5'-phosphate decarboxylase